MNMNRIHKPIRVLNLFTIMDRAGAETMAMNYYRKIDRTKVQFDFMVHRSQKGEYDDEIESMGGKIYHMPPIYPHNFCNYKKLLKQFFNEHDEYKIIHSNMSELGYFAFKEASKHGKKTLICHAHNAPKGFDLKLIMRTYFKYRIKKYTTDMFVCGQKSGDWLFGKKNRDKFVMMNNAIDCNKFTYDDNIAKKKRRELSISEDTFVVGHVGRLTKQKNHKFLFKVFKEILNINSNSILLLIGKGELQDELKKYAEELGIKDKIKFCGSRTDVNEIFMIMNAFVFPSLFEGLGIVVIEAQATGLPCYVADTIPTEAIKTDLVKCIPLKDSPKKWAAIIMNSHVNNQRIGYATRIEKSGFDICKNAKWLEEFYINEYKKNTNNIYSGI